ncbi:sulfotransferase domain-containing protein [Marinobacter sp. HL-58]|uniref:sulfotransferase domain-containing protein n=1 Tax=Marinobacter sp. HL-58 TaxID=1479237 RepID=UPI00068A022E|nr:sulfotransferase domain-containing protein [Marinobacter sp. HL-58]KPP97786.1 MAG: Sulfotransferase domain [Marinobacter sp. HL-58]
MKAPNFFIVGAPKCGTTSLAEWLGENPQVFMSDVKEPFFFSPDVVPSDYQTIRDYERLFFGAGNEIRAVGEASTTYLRSELAVKEILRYQPAAKFIVMLRDPVEMAVSLHSQELFSLNENISDFSQAWLAQGDRKKGYKIPKACRSPNLLMYKDICSLGTQLKSLFSLVGRERVCVIFMDSLRRDPLGSLNEVERFLGVNESLNIDNTPRNVRKTNRSLGVARALKAVEFFKLRFGFSGGTGFLRFAHKWNKRKYNGEPVDSEFLNAVRDEFLDEVCLLESLTGADLSSWKNVGNQK